MNSSDSDHLVCSRYDPSFHVRRIAGLEPIKETVHEFNMVKNPLEDWCTQQREYFEHLPPLEVTEEQLWEQAREFEAVTADIAAHREPSEKVEEMAQRFLRETEVGARMSGWVWSLALLEVIY